MALVEKKAKGVASNAHSKPLADYGIKDAAGNLVKTLNYEFSWFEYADDQSMIDAKDELTLEEQRKVRNVERKTKARQAANAAAILAAGIIAPTAETDSQIRLKKVYDGLKGKYLAAGMAEDEAHTKARTKAAEFLEEAWSDDEDE